MKIFLQMFIPISITFLSFSSFANATSLINERYGFESFQNGHIDLNRHSPCSFDTDDYDTWNTSVHNWHGGHAADSMLFSLPPTTPVLQFVNIEFDIWYFLSYQTTNVVSFDSSATASGYVLLRLVDCTRQRQVIWDYNAYRLLQAYSSFHYSAAPSFWLKSNHQHELLYDQSMGLPSLLPITNIVYGDDGKEGYSRLDAFQYAPDKYPDQRNPRAINNQSYTFGIPEILIP